jgi:hypothetical protein
MTYDISPHITGDTWDGIRSITFLKNNSAINLSNAYVEMNVLRSLDSPVVLSLTTNNSGINITNALSGTISISPTTINLPVDSYKWRIRIVLQNQEVKTYLMGYWPIVSNLPQ